jgi:hypothetical protein
MIVTSIEVQPTENIDNVYKYLTKMLNIIKFKEQGPS